MAAMQAMTMPLRMTPTPDEMKRKIASSRFSLENCEDLDADGEDSKAAIVKSSQLKRYRNDVIISPGTRGLNIWLLWLRRYAVGGYYDVSVTSLR